MGSRWGMRVTGLLAGVALIAGTGLVGLPVLGLGVPSAAAGTSCAASNTTVTTNADFGAGSLRTAIMHANTNIGAQTICIDTTTGNVTSPIALASSLPDYTNTTALTIQGNGATVDGGGLYTLIDDTSTTALTVDALTLIHSSGNAIGAAGAVTVTGSTIANNSVTGNAVNGGGIFASGPVSITASTINNNTLTGSGDGGGGIASGTSVTVMGSTITNNSVTGSGAAGGGVASFGAVMVTGSTIATNSANGNNALGGGIVSATSVMVTGSTIANNSVIGSNGSGGGIEVLGGSATVTNSTIANNSATVGAGGVQAAFSILLVYATVAQNTSLVGANLAYAASGLTSFASVVALPQGGGANCFGGGTTTSHGFNLEDDVGASCGFSTGAGDLTPGTSSGLGALANNGGTTLTVAPQVGSALVDAIPPAHCTDQGGSAGTADQIGTSRPQGPGCDIGAFEVPNTASQLVFSTEPGNGATGQALSPQPVVTIEDAYGRVVATDTAPIALTISAGTGTAGAVLSCTTNPLNAVAGVAAFTGCAINEAGTGYKLTATTDGLAVTSTAFNVGAGLPTRIFGVDAIGTAIAVSRAGFPKAGSASAVVLARSDFFSDALAGGPLAAKVGGPLLITPGTPLSASLDSRVLVEIQRVLKTGGTVYILGGTQALSSNIDTALSSAGYVVARVQGPNLFATAVAIANQLGNPSTVFEATGLFFADALSAVPVTIHTSGAILLTNGTVQAPETAAYLAAHSGDTRYAIGGPQAAFGADPAAIGVYGTDLYGTSAAVATRFLAHAAVYGAATGLNYPDALVAGVFMATGGRLGPVLLVNTNTPLPAPIIAYLNTLAVGTPGYVFGGPVALAEPSIDEALQAAVG